MFDKKSIIFRGGKGVFRVDDVIKLTNQKNEVVLYYVLSPIKDESKKIYIPVEGHIDELRALISFEKAKAKKESDFENLTPYEKEEVEYVLNNIIENV